MSSRCPNDSSNALNTEFQDETQNPLRKLYIAIGLCTLFMAVELVGGYLANSLAIISDAVHLLSDVAGFLTSIVAILISRRSATSNYSFGFQRIQTLGALVSIAFVWLITGYLVIEAFERIKNPENINGKMMFFIALFGVAVNIVLAFSLEHGGHNHAHHSHKHETHTNCEGSLIETGSLSSSEHRLNEDINLRAAFIHVIGDLVQSVGVLIASGIIWYRDDWRIADPICTLFFSAIVAVSTIFISREIFRILMEGTPKNIDVMHILEDLKGIDGVLGAHDLHVWAISPGNIALTVHVTINSDQIDCCQDEILGKIQEMLCTKYTIHHSTIQMEKKESLHCNPKYCVKNEPQ